MTSNQYRKKPLAPVAILLLGLSLSQVSGCAKSAESSPQATSPSKQRVAPQQIVVDTEVRALPGQLDGTPMFNSNSPEWVKQAGILLSTFPSEGKQVPEAHLNFPFSGKFTLFAHHFTHTPPDLQTLYIGIIVHNPSMEAVTLDILQAASYLLEPDAPFKQKPALSENPNGEVYSGPGIRAVDSVLRGIRQADFPPQLVIPAGESRMLMNHPIPVRGLERPINGRSSFLRLGVRSGSSPTSLVKNESTVQYNPKVASNITSNITSNIRSNIRSNIAPTIAPNIYAASLAMYAKKNADGTDRPPTLQEWQQLLNSGGLALPRDKTPSPPEQLGGQLIYSRVAGVQQGSRWQARLVDEGANNLTIPQIGKGISYAISTLRAGTLGTGQSQAAKLLARYPDTAYESHGNYGVHYDLTLPLFNPSDRPQKVAITLETPFKEEKLSQDGLIFRQPPWDFPFFRGTVRLRYEDDSGEEITRYLHLWHRRGQVVEPLLTLNLAAGEERQVLIDFLYPPDSTPPQVLTVRGEHQR